MSGHSRWHQIRHRKSITDAKRGKLFSKMARLISVAAKEKGGDPTMNPKLRLAIESAGSVGMPKDNIERAVLRASGGGETAALEEVRYEGYGPGGAALLILGVTDNKNRTTNEIKHILSEYGGKFAAQGSVEWMFEKIGALDIAKGAGGLAPDELAMALIDAGVKDIKEFSEGTAAYVSVEELEAVKEKLKGRGIAVADAHVDYVPKNPVSLSDDDKKGLAALHEALDEHDDVQEIFTNVIE